MNRPLQGPLNPTKVDHATDTYDTIDWLVKNVPESNGRVGIIGISYDGFLPLMALINPHPALKVSVPMNPMVDGWMGDDWFHNGAFRQQGMSYIYDQEATRANDIEWWTSHYDDYDMFMEAVSAGELGRLRGLEQVGFWRQLLAHPSYDAYWREQAMDKILAKQPLKVPVMLVHSLWDQEDIYGDIAVYKAIEPKDTNNDKVFLVLGPWHHGQEIREGSALGAIPAILSGEGLRVEERCERIAVRQTLRAGHFTSERDETAIRNLHHELALRRILRGGQTRYEEQKDPDLISHMELLL
jgi:putative CocE/NonD family hydrolase